MDTEIQILAGDGMNYKFTTLPRDGGDPPPHKERVDVRSSDCGISAEYERRKYAVYQILNVLRGVRNPRSN